LGLVCSRINRGVRLANDGGLLLNIYQPTTGLDMDIIYCYVKRY